MTFKRINNDLISRFSCSLLGNGRKQSGHKIFLESLFLVRQNDDKKSSFLRSDIANREEKVKEREEGRGNLLKFLLLTGLPIKTLQNGIKRFHDLQEKKGDSETQVPQNNYKNMILSLSYGDSLQSFDTKKNCSTLLKGTPSKEVALAKKAKKASDFSSRELPKISDTAQNKDLKRKESPSDLQYFNKTSLRSSRSEDSEELSNKSFLEICKENVKPVIETRNVRKGRVTYKVPKVTLSERQEGKAIEWLINNASLRKKGSAQASRAEEGSPLDYINLGTAKTSFSNKAIDDRKNNNRSIESCLASLLSDSFIGKGETVEKRKEFHKIALKNRSYTSYRWW